MRFLLIIQHQFTHINTAAVGRKNQSVTDFNRLRRAHMRMAGNQDIQPLYLTCGLDVFIQCTAHICTSLTRLTRWRTFMDQRHSEIDFTFKLIDIALQPLHFIPRFNTDTCRSRNRIIKSKHAVQANHTNLHAIFFNNGVRLIPEHFAAVLIKDITLHDGEFRLTQL